MASFSLLTKDKHPPTLKGEPGQLEKNSLDGTVLTFYTVCVIPLEKVAWLSLGIK